MVGKHPDAVLGRASRSVVRCEPIRASVLTNRPTGQLEVIFRNISACKNQGASRRKLDVTLVRPFRFVGYINSGIDESSSVELFCIPATHKTWGGLILSKTRG